MAFRDWYKLISDIYKKMNIIQRNLQAQKKTTQINAEPKFLIELAKRGGNAPR
jgi:hypothetical protein